MTFRGAAPAARRCYAPHVADLTDLHRALFTALAQTRAALSVAQKVMPNGHRVAMARSQIEAAVECLEQAATFAKASTSSAWIKSVNPPRDARSEEGLVSPSEERPFKR